MKFKRPKELVSERLREVGFLRPKLLFKPGRGDFFNRLSYWFVKGRYGIVSEREFGQELLPGKVLDEVNGVKLLAFKGEEKPDSAVVKHGGSVDFSQIEFNYPDFAVDLSLFNRLREKERKSLAVQIEISYGVVKDYFTQDNFYLISPNLEPVNFLKKVFKPFPFKLLSSFSSYSKVIVLDPQGEEEFAHEEVDENTLIVLGGIVDSSERLKGATKSIFPSFLHRRITYKGVVDVVPDRINEILEITCRYLTTSLDLYQSVKESLTRDSKLRFLRRLLQEESIRFLVSGELLRGIPQEVYERWRRELSLSDFFFRKGAKHISGFFVFRPSIFDRVIGETEKRGKRVFILKELKDEDVVAKYFK